MKPVCKKCGQEHYGYQKCDQVAAKARLKANQEYGGVTMWKTHPKLEGGDRIWNNDYLENFERRGNLIVERSGMTLRGHSRPHDGMGYYDKEGTQ